MTRNNGLQAVAPWAAARGDGDEDDAVPGLIPAGGLMIFYKSEGPLSFVTMTAKDRPAGARELGLSYSKLIGALKKKSIMLDRKILADFAEHHPNTFAKILEAVK